MAPNVSMSVSSSSVSVCSSSSRFSRRSSAGGASSAANSSLDRPVVRRRDVIRPIITITTPPAAVVEEGSSNSRSAMAGVQLLPLAIGSRNDFHEKSALAKIVLAVYRSSLLRDTAASKVEEDIKETTTMLSLVTPPRDQHQVQQLQNRPAVPPSRTGRDPEEIVRGKLRSKLLTKRSVRLDNNIDDDDSNNQITTTTGAIGAEDPPGEEPSIFPIVKLDIIGTPAAVAIPSAASTAMVVRQRRQRDAEPSMIDNAQLYESSLISLGTSSEISLDLSKDYTFNSSSGSNTNNRRTRSSIIRSNHHRNSNINVVRWVDTKNINDIAQVDMHVLQRYANLFVTMAQHHQEEEEEKNNKHDDNYYPTLAATIRGIDPDEDIFASSSSSTTTTTLDHHHQQQEHNTYTTNTNYNSNNNNVNDEEKVLQGMITNSRIRIATISCGFKRSNYFVREDLDTRIYFSSIEDAVGYMSIRGYCKMMGDEELEWRELFRRAHGVVKIGKNKHKQRYRKGKLVMILKKIITDDDDDDDDDNVDRIAKKKKHTRLEGGDFTTSCTTLTIAETERTSLGKSVRGPYKSYSEKFIAIQENLKRQCLLAIMEGRSLSDVDYHGNNGDDNDDYGGGMLLLTNGPATDSSSSIRGPVDPDPDINPTRRLTIASSSTHTTTSNYHSSSKSVNDVVTWKSGVTGGSVGMSRSRATTIGGVNSAPGVLEQVNDEMTKAPSVALGSARRGMYGGGVRYFTPDNSFYKSEGGTQSDTFEENEEESDYDEEDDDEEYDEDEDDEAESMSDNGTLVINEEGTCVSSLGNFTSKSSEEDESSTNSTIASYVIDERSGSADTRYRPYVKDVKTIKDKSDKKKKEKKSKKDKTKSSR